VLLFKCLLLLFISLLTQSKNFCIHPHMALTVSSHTHLCLRIFSLIPSFDSQSSAYKLQLLSCAVPCLLDYLYISSDLNLMRSSISQPRTTLCTSALSTICMHQSIVEAPDSDKLQQLHTRSIRGITSLQLHCNTVEYIKVSHTRENINYEQ
jgi:hypothetical protein